MRAALPIGYAVVALLLWFSSGVTRRMTKVYQSIMKIRDRRIDLTGDVLQGMRSLKYLCWESMFHGKLLEIRNQEFELIKKVKNLDSCCVVLWGITPTTIVGAAFIAYTSMGYDITKVNVFTVSTFISIT